VCLGPAGRTNDKYSAVGRVLCSIPGSGVGDISLFRTVLIGFGAKSISFSGYQFFWVGVGV
jgi:hypothetical protein